MTNSFKSGSGNLDFGSNDDHEETEDQNGIKEQAEVNGSDDHESSDDTPGESTERTTERATQPVDGVDDRSTTEQTKDTSSEEYPYYIRRKKVGDERDKRIELHLRDSVASDEPTFRNELAEEFDVDEVAKTDAREAALLFAFRNSDAVADLMREEGYGVFD